MRFLFTGKSAEEMGEHSGSSCASCGKLDLANNGNFWTFITGTDSGCFFSEDKDFLDINTDVNDAGLFFNDKEFL